MANGILIVNKPAGWTSQDVTAKLRGVFHEKRVGHGGTLDPMATGVLPVFIGRATRAVPFFEHADKVYEAVLRLGLVTDTQDITGRTLEERPVNITTEQLEAILPRFRGEILQIPPMYSAVKVNGQKLYALARKGKEVEREPRPVTVYELTQLHGFVCRGEHCSSADKQCLSLQPERRRSCHCEAAKQPWQSFRIPPAPGQSSHPGNPRRNNRPQSPEKTRGFPRPGQPGPS